MRAYLIGIDIAKHVFFVRGVNREGRKLFEKKLSRGEVMTFIASCAPCIIAIEACGSSHYWARRFREAGHEVCLISAQFVKPFVKSNKNDRIDAAAICEAALRPHMRFVGVKTVHQQEQQALHRIRRRLVRDRTSLVNELRGFLYEFGIVIPQNIKYVRRGLLARISESECHEVTEGFLQVVRELLEEFHVLDERIKSYDKRVADAARRHEDMHRLMTIPGVGALTAHAVVSSIGDISEFKNGRAFAAYLGLVPRQYSSGGKERLLGISKRGDPYIRTLLVHGARSVVCCSHKRTDRRNRWAQTLRERRGLPRTLVAMANRNARIIWRLLSTPEEVYDPEHIQIAA